MSDTDRLAKIRALLAKAEGTDNDHEAEVFTAKAAELMAKWQIDDAMLAKTKPQADRIAVAEIKVEMPYAKPKMILATVVARAFGCEVIYWWKRFAPDQPEGIVVQIVGYESDLARIDMLFTSLLLQAANAVQRQQAPRGGSTMSYRTSWLLGFGSGVQSRLAEANRKAQADADAEKTDGPSTALVLADRSSLVKAEYARLHPKVQTRTSVAKDNRGYSGGYAAGRDADIGGPASVGRQTAGALR